MSARFLRHRTLLRRHPQAGTWAALCTSDPALDGEPALVEDWWSNLNADGARAPAGIVFAARALRSPSPPVGDLVYVRVRGRGVIVAQSEIR